MAADQSSNIASTWKKMYSYQREENYDQNVFVEDIEDNEDGAIGKSLISIKMEKLKWRSVMLKISDKTELSSISGGERNML